MEALKAVKTVDAATVSGESLLDKVLGAQQEPPKQQSAEPSPGIPANPTETRQWTLRSSEIVRTEERLKKELARSQAFVGLQKEDLKKLAAQKEIYVRRKIEGEMWAAAKLTDILRKIEDQKLVLAEFEGQVTKAQEKLDGFRAWEEANAPERRKLQDALAAMAHARFEMDRDIAEKLAALRESLEARLVASNTMRQWAQDLGMDCTIENLLPDALYEAASLDLVTASRNWCDRFTGNIERLKPYMVVVAQFETQETLAQRSICKFGDVVYLTQAEALPLLGWGRPNPKDGRGWSCLPPTLMTVEEFEAEKKQASGPIQYHIQREHERKEDLRFRAYLLERGGAKLPEPKSGDGMEVFTW